jgi:hypothetical protein
METWRPGALEKAIGQAGRTGTQSMRMTIIEAAHEVERVAKKKAGERSHPYGTPTPATHGAPPAIVSGTLRRSIAQGAEEILSHGESNRKVGMAAGVYPPKLRATVTKTGKRSHKAAGGHGATPSSKYALYLETKKGHPFLIPAYREVVKTLPEIFRRHFDNLLSRRG